MMRALVPTLGSMLLLAACGGSAPPPSTPSAPPSSSGGAGAPEATATTDKHAAAEAAPHDDPNESAGPIVLDGLVAKGTPKSAFPKAATGDHDCLKELVISGKHKQDYATIIEKCGTPTGMLQYTKPAEGRLHAKLDKRDHFQLKVFKGMCYRYFAVGDDGIKDIDIVVLKKGALYAMDRTEQHIAVIETDKLVCADDDMDLDFAVEVDGPGAGGYTFGVWTRPK
jgi:hypothetical protein